MVAGPSEIFYGRNRVPGGFDYLNLSLRALALLNPTWFFRVKIVHSVNHGPTRRLSAYENLSVDLTVISAKHVNRLDRLGPSLQHGTLLNLLFAKSPPQSRYVMILDPDCFLVEKGILNSITQVMQERSIGVVGLPYPAWYPKEYSWKTPQLYFSLFDRSLIDPSKIDLRPGTDSTFKDDDKSNFDNSFQLRSVFWLKKTLLNAGIISKRGVLNSFLVGRFYALSNRYLKKSLDTGWRITEYIDSHDIKSLLCPFIVDGDIYIPGFNRGNFLKVNSDLSVLSENLGWYLLNHALIEGKNIGSQGFIPIILKKMIGGISLEDEKWPISSLISSANLINKVKFRDLKNKFPLADFYSFAERISFFHLGTQGKGRTLSETSILENLINELICDQV